ncbi:alpha-1,6-glucosidase domain-containing protein [Paraglaciecola hydrolytica]|uniref:Pullulanase n=1 Tax=Paraglaciecola hydrolytica TaxID=1799789 RepID=A0A136A6L3_9ALTE|nr:alpha-1,6-glucosidase domain-containing protein [Paraglaciecola hydrolytica]KXI30872.1 pullulanase [Paraglaciecola hydrolytica]
MFKKTKTLSLIMLMFSAIVLAGCGGSAVESGSNELLTCNVPMVPNSTGSMCVAPPPFNCAPPTVPNESNDGCIVGADPTAPTPSVSPGANQAVLYYNRAAVGATNASGDPSYEGYRLHAWSNDTCNAYADPDTDWANGKVHNGVDPNYGAYWVLNLKPGYAGTAGACGNFIIHDGDDKEMGGGDFQMPLSQDDPVFARMNFVFSGVASIFEFPIVSLGPQPVKIDGQAAHWLDANTLLWDVDFSKVSSVKLHYSATADLKVNVDTGMNGTVLELEEVSLSEEQIAIAPHLASLQAFQGNWSAEDAKTMLKSQAVLASYDSDGELNGATGIQIANAIDQLYTLGEADADEAQLGPIYGEDGSITAALWAPTAKSVKLVRYNDNKTLASTIDMTLDNNTGIWSYKGTSELDRTYYRFEVTVYHPKAEGMQVLLVTDPYSVSLSTNSRFSQFVNLNDEDLKPEGWDSQTIPTIAHFEDAVIYEGSIRDFSVRDGSTSAGNRGKYMAFTEMDSAPVMHLKKLAEKGLTHFHMLPANDIASIEEDVSKTVDFSSTLTALCKLNTTAAICKDAALNKTMTLGDLFASFDPISEAGKAQDLAEAMRGVDQFNWGYDPFHFNVPEGSFSSNPEGVTRIKEMRAMNMALHEMGLRVALDVVYNHTNASELNGKSVLDKVVPGYYHRYEVDTGAIVRETCCDDTEPRNAMMEKLMKDSLIQWATQYKFDSFRFDIMSQATKATMVRLFDAVKAVDEDMYFYGEGWTKEDRGYEQASQAIMAGTEIGTYNDRIREAVRQGHMFSKEPSDAALVNQDKVKMGLAGTLKDYILNTSGGSDTQTVNLGGYATDPADIINYVSKHDNETLWDQFNYVLPQDLTLAQRVRAQNIAATVPLMAQGIPFLQIGGDFLRSKSMDRNSYDSGDWFSYVDFTMATNNWNVGLPLKQDNEARWAEIGEFMNSPERAASMSEIEFASEVFNELLSIRSSSPLFRLTTGADVKDRIGFHNIGKRQTQGLIVMSIDDGMSADETMPRADLDPMVDALVVVVNSSYAEQSHTVATAAAFTLHATLMSSIDPTVRGAYFTAGEGEGTFTVPALTTAVFVKVQSGVQGIGLSSYATSGAPDVVPFGDTTVLVRGGMNGWGEGNPMTYVGSGVYESVITIAAGDYEFKVASADWSSVDFGSSQQVVTLGAEKVLTRSGSNLQLTLTAEATLKFSLDASDNSAPILIVDYEEPFYPTTVFIRGDMNGWGEVNPMSYAVGGQYAVTMDLVAGSYGFKVASADWSTVDFGSADGNGAVTVGNVKDLAPKGSNLSITIPSDGSYTFLFNVADINAPTISVFNALMFGDTTVFVRGSINGWGEADPLVYMGNSTYSAEIDIDAGDYEFKIASADWSTVDFGNLAGEVDVVLGASKALGRSGANFKLSITESGTYKFTVSGPDPSAPKVTVTKVTS